MTDRSTVREKSQRPKKPELRKSVENDLDDNRSKLYQVVLESNKYKITPNKQQGSTLNPETTTSIT
jgi:hypothetical protein